MALNCSFVLLLAVNNYLFTFFLGCHAHFQDQSVTSKSEIPSGLSPEEQYRDFLVITSENFEGKVLKETEPWIVLFHEGEILRNWITLAASIRGLCWLGMVNIKENKDILNTLVMKTKYFSN